MTKEITIGGKQYIFRSTAAIPRMYRLKFNRDIFVDMENCQGRLKLTKRNRRKNKRRQRKQESNMRRTA